MAKLTLTDLASLANQTSAVATINANHALLETALENTLSRDGTTPNSMSANFDMNSNRILNLPDAVSSQEPTTLSQVLSLVTGGTVDLSFPDQVYVPNQTLFVNSLAYGTGLRSSSEAGSTSFDGDHNTAIGMEAMEDNTVGYHNTAVGSEALMSSIAGHSNIAIGAFALLNATGPSYTVTIGNSSHRSNTNSSQNTSVGYQNFYQATASNQNASLGIYCGFRQLTGGRDTFVGAYAGYQGDVQDAVMIGHSAGVGVNLGSTGTGDVFIGYQSGYSGLARTGYNTFVGWRSGYSLTTGSGNIQLGTGPNDLAEGVTSGSYNIQIGFGVRYGFTKTANYQLNIGNLIFGSDVGVNNSLSTGRISIGGTPTASGAKFEVLGDISTSGGMFKLEGAGSYGPFQIFHNTGTNGAEFWMGPADDAWGSVANKFIMGHGAIAGANIDITIDSSGNLGLQTTSPTTLLDINSNAFRVRTARTVATASTTGAAGEISWDASYIYVCVATDTWKRVAIATWA